MSPVTSLVENVVFVMEGGNLPWPEDAQLFTPYEMEQILLPDNANCHAVQALLNMWKLPFSIEMRWNAEWMSPSGRVPFLKCGNFLVPEFEGITQHCDKRGVIPPEYVLKPEEIADMRAYISLVCNVLYYAELYICWVDEQTYNNYTSIKNGSVFPWPLSCVQNWIKRSRIIKQLKLFKWYEKSLDDVLKEVHNCCMVLSERLGDEEYFFGSRLTELDALVFGHIFIILTTDLPNDHLAGVIKEYKTLTDFAVRIENTYYRKKKSNSIGGLTDNKLRNSYKNISI